MVGCMVCRARGYLRAKLLGLLRTTPCPWVLSQRENYIGLLRKLVVISLSTALFLGPARALLHGSTELNRVASKIMMDLPIT